MNVSVRWIELVLRTTTLIYILVTITMQLVALEGLLMFGRSHFSSFSGDDNDIQTPASDFQPTVDGETTATEDRTESTVTDLDWHSAPASHEERAPGTDKAQSENDPAISRNQVNWLDNLITEFLRAQNYTSSVKSCKYNDSAYCIIIYDRQTRRFARTRRNLLHQYSDSNSRYQYSLDRIPLQMSLSLNTPATKMTG
jgi:hypothetical protein